MEKLVLIIVVVLIVSTVHINQFSNGMIQAKYIMISKNTVCNLAETPPDSDTLYLFKNGTLESGYYGKGHYKIIRDLFSTRIRFKSQNNSSCVLYISRIGVFERIKLIYSEDPPISYYVKQN